MIGVEGGPLGPSPYSGLDKQASRKVINMPPYSSLNNKREAPAYEELINFPRAKDKVRALAIAFVWLVTASVGVGVDLDCCMYLTRLSTHTDQTH
jgi:hypothetical protein